ncbi:MAG TPA: PTS sugar transporter subunit IIC [Syntrophales bacterium]|nr:PTS sugar transporter subunit IIC [Syntrophales bacterium]HQG33261.1 PTS sugar transporter subunit IIC [Syntrophales bacterium]HRR45988.1 PTS sugar transporter subunit IIC [Syntrophales bacterium]HRU87431.1 PTS sugar transporter subunit IIC [Syntrophales bacterium]
MTAVSIVGGFLCLDRTCVQMMISRPVVVAPLAGWALGDIRTGLIVGAFLELLWIDKQQIGIYVPPNDSLLAIVIVTSLLLADVELTTRRQELTAFAFLSMIPMGYLTTKLDAALIRGNETLSENALRAAAAGDVKAIRRQHHQAVLRTLAAYVSFLFLASAAGIVLVGALFPLLPARALRALQLMYVLIPVVLIAVSLNTIKFRRLGPVFCALVLASLVVIELLHAF